MLLNVHSWFSLRYGLLSPADIIRRWLDQPPVTLNTDRGDKLAELLRQPRSLRQPMATETPAGQRRYSPIALTDINTVSGIPDFFREAGKHGLHVCGGVDFRNGATPLYVALAHNEDGFEEINRWLSLHLMEHRDFPPVAPPWQHCTVIYPFSAVSAPGFRHPLRNNEYIGIKPSDIRKLRLSALAQQPERLTALCTATYRHQADRNTHKLLRCMANNCLLSKLPSGETGSDDDFFVSEEQAELMYRDFPALLANTRRILEHCSYKPEFGVLQNKKTFTGCPQQDYELLCRLAEDGLKYRYPDAPAATRLRLQKELDTIRELGFTAYFLISWDIVRYAQQKGYFYVGRGSGANSLAAYCLRITDVDPIDLDLYFERFINPYRTSPPDFDLDFSWKDRDDVTRYIFEKHGAEHTALLATYSTFQTNAVVRELGKVFGLPKEEIDHFLDRHTYMSPRSLNSDKDQLAQRILHYAKRLHDMPNYRSIHAGGILISDKPIYRYSATDLPPKGFPTVQWSMLEAEDLGLHKFDILSQRGLGHIRDAVEIVRENRGVEIDIHQVSRFKEDPLCNRLLSTGRAMGCFYVESPAMRQLLRKLRCSDYLTLVAASSVIRPGVASSGMMREYILRHLDPERRKLAHPVLLDIMPDTYGIMVYQEDVIKVAHHFAGLSLSESDVLRRGMSGKYRSREEFRRVKESFFDNCRRMGHPEQLANEVWHQIESFAGYSFAKGHSASYAVESYQSLYLKAHYPLEFYTAVINNFGGFYRTEFYVHAARMCGASVQAPCVNNSTENARLQNSTLWLGLGLISGLESKTIRRLLQEREENGPYRSLADFTERVACGLEQIKLLVRIGAFRFTGKNRKQLMWEAHWLLNKKKPLPESLPLFREKPRDFRLPQLEQNKLEDAFEQIELLGFPLCDPFLLIQRDEPAALLRSAARLPSLRGHTLSIDGYLVTVKPTRTLRGEEMNFGTWLDSEGHFFDTVHFPPSIRQFPFRGRGVYRITGRVTEECGVHSLEVTAMHKLPVIEDPRYAETRQAETA